MFAYACGSETETIFRQIAAKLLCRIYAATNEGFECKILASFVDFATLIAKKIYRDEAQSNKVSIKCEE